MSHPTKKFRPVGKRATKVPRQTFNWMGRVAEKCSNLGVNGYEASDAIAVRPDVDRVFKLVEVMDSDSNRAGVLNYQTVQGDYINLPSPEFSQPSTGDWNRGTSSNTPEPYETIVVSSYGTNTPGELEDDPRRGYIFPRGYRLWVVQHGHSGLWTPLSIPVITFELKTNLAGAVSAEARVVERGPPGEETGFYANTAFYFVVQNNFLMFAGWAGENADIGYAVWDNRLGGYQVVQISSYYPDERGFDLPRASSRDYWENAPW